MYDMARSIEGQEKMISECLATERFLTYHHVYDAHLALRGGKDFWWLVCQGSCAKDKQKEKNKLNPTSFFPQWECDSFIKDHNEGLH